MKYLIILFLSFPFTLSILAQPVSMIDSTGFPGITINRTDTYTGESLANYLHSGPELFMEYGLDRLYVQHLTCRGEPVISEIYQFKTPQAAFGIYTLLAKNCLLWNTLSDFSCLTAYYTQLAFGNLYLSLGNKTGSGLAQQLSGEVATRIIQKNPQIPFQIPGIFNQQRLIPYINTLNFTMGPLGLQTILPQWTDLMTNVTFSMYTIQPEYQNTPCTLARILFPGDDGSMQTFLSNANLPAFGTDSSPIQGFNGLYHSYIQLDDFTILFLESQNQMKISDLIEIIPPVSGF